MQRYTLYMLIFEKNAKQQSQCCDGRIFEGLAWATSQDPVIKIGSHKFSRYVWHHAL